MRNHRPEIVEYRGKWCLKVWIDGERKRLSLGNLDATGPRSDCPNYPAAEREAARLRKELAQPVGVTCADIVQAYQDDKKVSEKPLVDEERVQNAWKALKPHFAALTPDDISRDVCREYIRLRRAIGRQDGTIRKELSVLRAAVNWAGKGREDQFEMPPPPPAKDLWVTRAEFNRLLAAAGDLDHLVVFLHLAIATAARKEALFQLRWKEHVRWQRNEIWLGFKANGKARSTVPITPTLRTVLRDAERKAESDFVIEYDGEPITSVRHALESACKRAKLFRRDNAGELVLDKRGAPIPLVTPHGLRHSAGVWMAADGVPLEEIAAFMGHSDIEVTRRIYARHQPEHMKKAMAAVTVPVGARKPGGS